MNATIKSWYTTEFPDFVANRSNFDAGIPEHTPNSLSEFGTSFLMVTNTAELRDEPADDTHNVFHQLASHLGDRIVGQAGTIERMLVALLADGHVLLESPPGLAKTRIARLLAESIEGSFKRIQFTPDLLPSDLVGASIYHPAEARFEFQHGPLFANIILADEINRAPAKVQSALLEAMEERQITVGETSYPLASPFFVIATQNPIEHEGTWDLPKAQLDRFLMQITLDFPSIESEQNILDLAMTEAAEGLAAIAPAPSAEISRAQLHAARIGVSDVHVSDPIKRYIVRLIGATRDAPEPLPGVGEHIANPVSPRGTIMLARACQARAWLHDRDHVLPEDVIALAPNVLRHRIGLTYRAEADQIGVDTVIAAILDQIDVV